MRQHLDREHDGARHALALESVQGPGRLAASAERVRPRLAGVHRESRECEADHDRESNGARDPAAAHDQLGPGLPAAAEGGRARAHAVFVECRAPRGEDHRQQGDGGRDRDERDQHPGQTDAAQERHRQHHEREQSDSDGRSAEDDRATGRGAGGEDRLLVGASGVAFLAPAGDQQQRVVDSDPEPHHGDQVLDQEVDADRLLEPEDEQEGREDRWDCDQQRHDRDRRGVHEQEHGERAERADHRDEEHARPTAATAAVRLDLLEPGHRDGHAGGRRGAQRRSDRSTTPCPAPTSGLGTSISAQVV